LEAAHPHLYHILRLFFVSYTIFAVLTIVPLFTIAKKAGLHFAIALLALAPGIGTLIAIYILAFSPWKTPVHSVPPIK
jgi:hypothetical protein